MDGAAVLHDLFDAIEAGDVERFTALYSPGARIWHNVDQRDQSLTDSIAMHTTLKSVIVDTRYTERRYFSIPGGAISQHVVVTRVKDGTTMTLPVMARYDIVNGLITRVEEYFDAAQSAPVMEKLASFWPQSHLG